MNQLFLGACVSLAFTIAKHLKKLEVGHESMYISHYTYIHIHY